MSLLWLIVAAYYAVALLFYWLPLIAVWRKPVPFLPPDPAPGDALPRFIVIGLTRGSPESIPGLVACFRKQDYPADRYRTLILIDSVDRGDPSAEIARRAGAEVYERFDAMVKTKGASLNELLETTLKDESWDAIFSLDIDVRPAPHFLTRVAAYLNQGAQVIQTAPLSKNPFETSVSRISDSAQRLSQLIQRGRAALGLSAILSGTGMVFSRKALERLQWKITTGANLSDDGELNLRCYLNDIPITYGPDLELRNDLPTDAQAVRLQRRRWFAAYPEARPHIGPLMRKAFHGNWRVLEGLFTLVFMPGCSLTFLLGAGATTVLGIASLYSARWIPALMTFGILWFLHGLYYFCALRTVSGALSWKEFARLPNFLWLRLVALYEGAVLGSRANPGRYSIPSDHKADD